jgi:hypothetical protein
MNTPVPRFQKTVDCPQFLSIVLSFGYSQLRGITPQHYE